MGFWRCAQANLPLIGAALGFALVFAGSSAAAQDTLQVGSTVSGALSTNDATLDSGRYVDSYEFYGRAGQQIQIDVTTTAFDAATAIGDGANFFEIDDSSRAGTNASLRVTLPASGQYFITVSSAELWRTGSYVIRISDLGARASAPPDMAAGLARSRPVPVAPAPAPAYTSQDSVAGVQPPVRIGDVISGSLGQNDDALETGSLIDAYRFQGRAGQRVRLTVRPNGFNAVVAIGSTEGDFFEMHDTTETGSSDADLTVVLPRAGEYIVAVNARYPRQTGAYTLWVTEGQR
jgi:Bacterial pre-peptidase C-terminal domain